jgi:hypothetical protein
MDDKEAIKASFKPLVESISYSQEMGHSSSKKYQEAKQVADGYKDSMNGYRAKASAELTSLVLLLNMVLESEEELTEESVLSALGVIDRWDENREVYSDVFAILGINKEESNG